MLDNDFGRSRKMRPFDWHEAPAADFAVVGDPVAHSLSPQIHRAAYAAVGLEYNYVAIHVPEGEFDAAADHLRELGTIGINVTVPHKVDAFSWCEAVESGSWRFGAVNTIRLADRSGINTDVPGFLTVLDSYGITPSDRLVFLGAGGSARALIAACVDLGFQVSAWNRTPQRLTEMARELSIDLEVLESPDPTGAAAVVNATSASLSGEVVAVDWGSARSDCLAFDLAYRESGPTPFLAQAMEHGHTACDGLPMLVEQAALAFEWWLERDAPRQAMLASVGL